MAPAVLVAPRSPAHKELAYGHNQCSVRASLTPVSKYADIVAVVAGKQKVEDFDFSYGVYANGCRVICFAEGRIGYREWASRNGRLADIHSLDDRLDHDVDELMA